MRPTSSISGERLERMSHTCAEHGRWIYQPQSHLSHANVVVFLGKLEHDGIAQSSRTQNLRKDRPKQKTQKEETLDLRTVLWIGNFKRSE